ncbi:hypothetical protein C8Q79DRAFT_194989 [Trametes meyenii]|nr:hypothetical protein C8Q79DRAFT_194989 [Trametes meyenii]
MRPSVRARRAYIPALLIGLAPAVCHRAHSMPIFRSHPPPLTYAPALSSRRRLSRPPSPLFPRPPPAHNHRLPESSGRLSLALIIPESRGYRFRPRRKGHAQGSRSLYANVGDILKATTSSSVPLTASSSMWPFIFYPSVLLDLRTTQVAVTRFVQILAAVALNNPCNKWRRCRAISWGASISTGMGTTPADRRLPFPGPTSFLTPAQAPPLWSLLGST